MNISSFLIGYQTGKNAGGGGGSSADVRYVTFMSYDGTEEHGRLPVAVGYDCPNPKFTVTRESTAQYNFVHDAWATKPNGATDANALKAVTEDRVVYATFISVLRSYTITFCDEDGTVLLHLGDWGLKGPRFEIKDISLADDGSEDVIAVVEYGTYDLELGEDILTGYNVTYRLAPMENTK